MEENKIKEMEIIELSEILNMLESANDAYKRGSRSDCIERIINARKKLVLSDTITLEVKREYTRKIDDLIYIL